MPVEELFQPFPKVIIPFTLEAGAIKLNKNQEEQCNYNWLSHRICNLRRWMITRYWAPLGNIASIWILLSQLLFIRCTGSTMANEVRCISWSKMASTRHQLQHQLSGNSHIQTVSKTSKSCTSSTTSTGLSKLMGFLGVGCSWVVLWLYPIPGITLGRSGVECY